LARSSEDLAQAAGLRLSRRRSSDATRMDLLPRSEQQLKDYGASPPVRFACRSVCRACVSCVCVCVCRVCVSCVSCRVLIVAGSVGDIS
jgi:hypothetical protein